MGKLMWAKKLEREEKQAAWEQQKFNRDAMSRGLCLNYLKFGGCNYGDACKFLHKDDASDASSTTLGYDNVDDWSIPQALTVPDVPVLELSAADQKEVRKAEKKLREIAKIELLMVAGEKVDVLQRQKVAQKVELVRQ